MKKPIVIIGVVIAAVILAGVSYFQIANQNTDRSEPLLSLLKKQGYVGTSDEWFEALNDEQKASVDISYESDASAGYKGTKSEWMAEKLRARYGHDGEIVVILPDGGEFVLDKSSVSADSSTNDASAGRLGTPQSGQFGRSDNGGSSSLNGPSDSGEGGGSAESISVNSAAGEPSSGNSSGASLIVDSVWASAGDTDVAVSVRIEGNPGILGMTISVSYDESAVALKDAENGNAFKDVLSLTRSRALGTGCVFTWDGIEINREDVKDGEVLILHFDVSRDAKAGDYPIVIRGGDTAFTNDIAEVSLVVHNGSIRVE